MNLLLHILLPSSVLDTAAKMTFVLLILFSHHMYTARHKQITIYVAYMSEWENNKDSIINIPNSNISYGFADKGRLNIYNHWYKLFLAYGQNKINIQSMTRDSLTTYLSHGCNGASVIFITYSHISKNKSLQLSSGKHPNT